MPLLLRRGTNAERLTITPQNGELIYVTDTKQLFVGDGTTVGGNGVTSSFGGTVLNDDLNVNGQEINGLGTINLIGTIRAQEGFIGDIQGGVIADDSVYMIDTATKEGYFSKILATTGFEGDLTGSVFASDSSVVIDGNSGIIHAFAINSPTNNIEIYNESAGINNNVTIKTIEEGSTLSFKRADTSDRALEPDLYGTITFARDDINGNFVTSTISGGNFGLYINHDSNGIFPENKTVSVVDGNIGIGIAAPTVKLEVMGNTNIAGVLTVFGDIIGDRIIGTYLGGLIANDSSLIIDGDTKDANFNNVSISGNITSDNITWLSSTSSLTTNFDNSLEFSVNSGITNFILSSIDERSVLTLQRSSSSDLSIGNDLQGAIFFKRTDAINGDVITGVITGGNDGIFMFSDKNGSFSETSTLNLVGNKVGIGTYYPAETLDVRGSAVFSGEIKAMSVNGMIIADDSSVIVNPATNTVTADTITANELLTLAARSSAPASPTLGMIALADRTTWDPLSVGSGNPYLVLYDGSAWVALA